MYTYFLYICLKIYKYTHIHTYIHIHIHIIIHVHYARTHMNTLPPGGDELDFLGLEDGGGRPKISKKKQGKSKDKKGGDGDVMSGEGGDMSEEDDGAMTTEAKAKRGRPSAGRVRIDSNVQVS